MVGDTKKLRQGLANLFKLHGSMTANTNPKNPTKSSSRFNNTREESISRGRKSENVQFQNTNGSTPKKKNLKKTQNIQMEQGKGPLRPQDTPKKSNGKLNGTSLHNENSKKKAKSGKEPIGKPKSSRSSGGCQAEVKKADSRERLDIAEDSVKSQKKAVNNKNSKQKAAKAPKVQVENNANSKKQSKKNEKDKNKGKTKKPEAQEASNTANSTKKRKILESKGPTRKKSKTEIVSPPVNEIDVWEPTEASGESDSTEEEYADSILWSDYDTDMDDTFEIPCSDDDDYDDYDIGDDDDDYSSSMEYSPSSDEHYTEESDYDCDSLDEHNIEEGSFNDPDYELPQQEVEDLIIHKGLAVTYKLESHHGVEFDENNEESHIVEIPNQSAVKTITQHGAYDVKQLRLLELDFIEKKVSSAALIDDDCPNLVPIEEDEEDDEGFKLWTSGITMDDEIFSDCELVEDSDESSTLSYSDVNRKYLKRLNGSDSDSEEDDSVDGKEAPQMKAVVVNATETDTEKDKNFVKKLDRDIETLEANLSDIIRETRESLKTENVKIVKGVIDNYDDEFSNENASDENEESKQYHLQKVAKKLRKGIANDEDSFDTTENLGSTNLDTNEDNFPIKLGAELVEEICENIVDENVEADNEICYANTKSKFCTKFCNSIDSYYVLVLLKSPFYIYGTIKAKLIAGSTEVYGYKLQPGKMVTLHSPRGCSAVPLKPTSTQLSTLTLKERLESQIFADITALRDEAEFNPRAVKQLINDFDPTQDAILILTRNEAASKIKHIFQQHVNENIYPAHIPQSRPFSTSENMLDCMVNESAEYALQIPQPWHELSLQKTSKLMLVGGKSVGKSTFLRYLLNKHLADFPRILVIDLDIGQPEIFISQTVSCALLTEPFLGPGFFWQIQPDKAYAVGHTNLVLCAHAYMRAVLKLLAFCQAEPAYKNVPWLINTMGYNKGFGGELISVICAHLQPTDVIQLQSNKLINNFDMLLEPCVVASIPRNIYNKPEFDCSDNYQPNHKLHIVPSAILQQSRYQREWQMSAKDMRYIMLLARLSSILPDESEWINCSDTYCHDLQKLKIVNLTTPNANETETLKSLESNLVYLCYSSNVTSESTYNDDAQGVEPLECLGIGIVRGIDHYAKQIFIMPAMPKQKLSAVNCLALGEMPLPGSLLTEQNPETKYNVPFVQVMNNEATSRAVKQFFYRT